MKEKQRGFMSREVYYPVDPILDCSYSKVRKGFVEEVLGRFRRVTMRTRLLLTPHSNARKK